MSRKKKRRGARPARPPAPARREPQPPNEPQERRGFASFLFRPPGPAVFPTLRASLGRGMLVSASTPALLIGAFALAGAVWLLLVSLGFESSPSRLVHLLAIAPISTQFDGGTVGDLLGSGLVGLLVVNGLLLVRSILVAVATGVIVEALEGHAASTVGLWRGLRAFPAVLGMHIASFGILILGNLLLPTLAGPLGVFALVFGQYILLVLALGAFAFVPVAAVREGRPMMETFRRSWRAARLPSGHLLLVLGYVTITLFALPIFVPGGGALGANPSVELWGFILAATFLHLSFMGAFAYRWMSVESEVPDAPARRR